MASIPALGLAQVAVGTSLAPLATLEAALVWLALLAALLVLRDLASDRAAAFRLAGVALAAVLAQAAFAVVQSSRTPGAIYGERLAHAMTPFGSYVNHNHFAGLVEMGIPLALGWALGLVRRDRGPTPAVLGLFGAALALTAAHLASRSRGGLIALVAAVTVLAGVWWLRHRTGVSRPVVAVTGVLALVGVVAFGWLAVPAETRQHLSTVVRGSGTAAGSYRLDIARATARLALSRPALGAGLGAYADAVTPFKTGHGDVRTAHAEDDVLQFVAEGGLVGCLLLAGLAWPLVCGARATLGERGDPVRRGLAAGALAGIAGLLVHSFLDFNLHLPANALLFCVLVALASPSARSTARPPERLGPPWSTGVALLVLATAALAGERAVGAAALEEARAVASPRQRIQALSRAIERHPYLEDAYRDRGLARIRLAERRSLSVAQLELAELDLRRALRWRPASGELWCELAWVQWAAGDASSARRSLEQARTMDPSHRGIAGLAEQFLRQYPPI